jgi:predicted dithiol-disulfide oxidoreductase (DUF899 family)
MQTPPIVSPDEWEEARQRLLAMENWMSRRTEPNGAQTFRGAFPSVQVCTGSLKCMFST